MAGHRSYTRQQKVTAVLAADMTSQEAAAEATGIPRTTIRYWLNDPEMAEFRHNARASMVEEALVVARLAWFRLAEAIRDDRLDPDQLIIAAGMATDKSQLLSGGATTRTETRELTGTLDDHERAALRDILDEALREAEEPAASGAGEPPA